MLTELLVSVAAFVVVVLIWLIAFNAWPVSALFAAALTAYLATREFDNPWARAARGIAVPSAFGFGIVTVLLLAFNLVPRSGAVADTASTTELFLLRLSSSLPAWLRPNIWQVALILCVLLAINALFPSVTLVAGFLRAKKLVGRLTATLAVVTSCSFFGSDAVLGTMVAGPAAAVTARYRASEGQQRQDVEKYLLLQTKAEALIALPLPQRQYIAHVHRTLTRIETRAPSAAMEIANTVSVESLRRAPAPTALDVERPATRLPDGFMWNPEAELARQKRREDTARRLAGQAEQAFEEAINAVVGTGTKEGQVLAHALIDPFLEGVSVPFRTEFLGYLDRVQDEFVKKLLAPTVKRAAGELAGRMRSDVPPPGDVRAASVNAVSSVVVRRLREARELASSAAARLPKVTLVFGGPPRPRPQVTDESLVEAEREVRQAEGLLEIFGPAAAVLGIGGGLMATVEATVAADESALEPHRKRLQSIALREAAIERQARQEIRNQIRDRVKIGERDRVERRRTARRVR